MADIIDILIRAQDFASQKIARVRGELQKLERQGGGMGQTAQAVERIFDTRVLEEFTRRLNDETAQMDLFGTAARQTREELERMGQMQLPRALGAHPGIPAPGFEATGQQAIPVQAQSGRFLGSVRRQVEDIQEVETAFEQVGKAIEVDRNQLSLLREETRRISRVPEETSRFVQNLPAQPTATPLQALENAALAARKQTGDLNKEIENLKRTMRSLGRDLLPTFMPNAEADIRKLEQERDGLTELQRRLERLQIAMSRGPVGPALGDFERLRQAIPSLGQEFDKLRQKQQDLLHETELAARVQRTMFTGRQQRDIDEATQKLDIFRGQLARVREEMDVFVKLRGERSFEEFARSAPLAAREMRELETQGNALTRAIGNTERKLTDLEHAIPRGPFGRLRHDFALFGGDLGRIRAEADAVIPSLGGIGRAAGDGERAFGGIGGGIIRFSQAVDDLSGADEVLALGLKRVLSFVFAMGFALPVLETALGSVLAAAVALGGGVTELAAAFGTLVGLLGTLPALLAGFGGAAAAALGIFGPVLTKIVGRVQELQRARDVARRAAPGEERKAARSDEATSAAREVARTRRENTEQLKAAEQDFANLVKRNNEQELDQVKEIGRTRRDNLEQEHDLARDIAILRQRDNEQERDLAQDITRQRVDGIKQVKDAEAALAAVRKRNAVTERQLELDASEARAEVMGLRAQGASGAAIGAARGRLDEALAAQKVGAVDAQQTEKEAAQRVQDVRVQNARTLRDMETQLARMRRDNNHQENDAETRLARMKRDDRQEEHDGLVRLARTRRDDATQEEDALLRIRRVRRDNAQQVADLLARQGKAQDAANKEAERNADAMKAAFAGLDPVQQRILKKILDIKDRWNDLTKATRMRGERLGEKALDYIDKHLPAITKVVNGFGQDLLDVADKLAHELTTPPHLKSINRLFQDGRELVRKFGTALTNLIDPILNIADAARPLTRHLGDMTVGLTENIRDSVAAAATPVPKLAAVTGGTPSPGGRSDLQRFFGETKKVVDILVRSLRNLGDAFLNVMKIAEPFGVRLLRDFEKWTKHVDDFTKSKGGRKSIRDFFRDALPAFEDVIKTAARVIKALFNIGRELIRPGSGRGGRGTALGDLLKTIRDGMPGFEKAIERVTKENLPIFIDLIKSVFNALDSLTKPNGPLPLIIKLLNLVFDIFNKLGPLRPIIATLFTGALVAPAVVKSVESAAKIVRTVGAVGRGVRFGGSFLFGRAGREGGPSTFLQRFETAFPRTTKVVRNQIGLWERYFPRATGAVRIFTNGAISQVSRVALKYRALAPIAKDALSKLKEGATGTLFQKTEQAVTRVGVKFRGLGPLTKRVFDRIRGDAGRVSLEPMRRALDKGRPLIQRAMGRISGVVASSLNSAVPAARALGPKIVTAFSGIATNIVGAFGVIRGAMTGLVVFARAAGIAAMTPPGLFFVIGAIIIALVLLDRKFHFIMPVVRALGRVFKAAGKLISEGFKDAIDFVKKVVTGIIDFLKKHWKTIVTILVAIFLPGGIIIIAIIKFRGKIKEILGDIVDFFKRLPGRIATAIGNLAGFLVDKAKALKDGFVDKVREIGGELVRFFRELPGKLTGLLGGFGQAIAGFFKGPINAVIRVINRLKIPGFHKRFHVPLIGDVNFRFGGFAPFHIPTLARGGVVPGTPPADPRRDTVRAMLRPREVVLTEPQVRGVATRLGISDDPHEFFDAVRRFPESGAMSVLNRSLFTAPIFRVATPAFALGGVVPFAAPRTDTTKAAASAGTTVNAPITVTTASPTVDAEYLARALESRLGRF